MWLTVGRLIVVVVNGGPRALCSSLLGQERGICKVEHEATDKEDCCLVDGSFCVSPPSPYR